MHGQSSVQNWTHLLLYVRSPLFEQTTPQLCESSANRLLRGLKASSLSLSWAEGPRLRIIFLTSIPIACLRTYIGVCVCIYIYIYVYNDTRKPTHLVLPRQSVCSPPISVPPGFGVRTHVRTLECQWQVSLKKHWEHQRVP